MRRIYCIRQANCWQLKLDDQCWPAIDDDDDDEEDGGEEDEDEECDQS